MQIEYILPRQFVGVCPLQTVQACLSASNTLYGQITLTGSTCWQVSEVCIAPQILFYLGTL